MVSAVPVCWAIEAKRVGESAITRQSSKSSTGPAYPDIEGDAAGASSLPIRHSDERLVAEPNLPSRSLCSMFNLHPLRSLESNNLAHSSRAG